MSVEVIKLKRHNIKTTAVLIAVVFLFAVGGCRSHHDCDRPHRKAHPHTIKKHQPETDKKPRVHRTRKRAGDYSRIPRNYPASWQTRTIGN